MRLNTLKPAAGSKPARKRVGRGIGSGLGKTGGRHVHRRHVQSAFSQEHRVAPFPRPGEQPFGHQAAQARADLVAALSAGLGHGVQLAGQQGFERALNLNGGITAWQGAGLPLTKKK